MPERKGWEGRGEAALCTTFSGACHSVCQQPGGGVPREKGRLSRPCPTAALGEQHRAVCTTTALLFGVCALPSAAESGPSQGLLGIPGRQRLHGEAPLLPQSRPGCSSGGGGTGVPRGTRFPSHAQVLLSPWSCLLCNVPNPSQRGE